MDREYFESMAVSDVGYCSGEEIEATYVAGFLIHRRGYKDDWVALIEKKRPTWQCGRLNAIGGKIEAGETAMQAMQREFKEETNIDIQGWRCFMILKHGKAMVFMFIAFTDYVVLEKTTDEEPNWYHTSVVENDKIIANLKWLIPLALSGNKECGAILDDSPLPRPLHE